MSTGFKLQHYGYTCSELFFSTLFIKQVELVVTCDIYTRNRSCTKLLLKPFKAIPFHRFLVIFTKNSSLIHSKIIYSYRENLREVKFLM